MLSTRASVARSRSLCCLGDGRGPAVARAPPSEEMRRQMRSCTRCADRSDRLIGSELSAGQRPVVADSPNRSNRTT